MKYYCNLQKIAKEHEFGFNEKVVIVARLEIFDDETEEIRFKHLISGEFVQLSEFFTGWSEQREYIQKAWESLVKDIEEESNINQIVLDMRDDVYLFY